MNDVDDYGRMFINAMSNLSQFVYTQVYMYKLGKTFTAIGTLAYAHAP